MDQDKVNVFISNNANKLPDNKILLLKSKMLALPNDKEFMLATVSLKDPVVALVLSLLFGYLGVDRFYLGQIGLGILKLFLVLAFGVGLIWVLIDFFIIMGKTKELNFYKIMLFVC